MIEIIGAGMAGLLAAQMLRRWKPRVREAQAHLPDNHGALLRFRSLAVSEATGIPFLPVLVRKGIWWQGRLRNEVTVPMMNAYSLKVTGEVHARSLGTLRTEPVERYVAPDDFLARLADGVNIIYGDALSGIPVPDDLPAISTIPMESMMRLARWPTIPAFRSRAIWTLAARVTEPHTNVYQTLYYPEAQDTWPCYRASLTGDRLMIECMTPIAPEARDRPWVQEMVCEHFGLGPEACATDWKVTEQRYGKILPVDEDIRRQFILALTDRYGVYSLGRFATWRQIILDDLVKDVRHIERFLSERDGYARSLASLKR